MRPHLQISSGIRLIGIFLLTCVLSFSLFAGRVSVADISMPFAAEQQHATIGGVFTGAVKDLRFTSHHFHKHGKQIIRRRNSFAVFFRSTPLPEEITTATTRDLVNTPIYYRDSPRPSYYIFLFRYTLF